MEVTHNVADENKEEAEELFLLYRPRQGINDLLTSMYASKPIKRQIK